MVLRNDSLMEHSECFHYIEFKNNGGIIYVKKSIVRGKIKIGEKRIFANI